MPGQLGHAARSFHEYLRFKVFKIAILVGMLIRAFCAFPCCYRSACLLGNRLAPVRH